MTGVLLGEVSAGRRVTFWGKEKAAGRKLNFELAVLVKSVILRTPQDEKVAGSTSNFLNLISRMCNDAVT